MNNSLVWVEIVPEIGNKFVSNFDISMFVRTRKKNGTIFLLGNEVNGNSSSVYLEAEIGDIGNLVVNAKWNEDTTSKLEVYAVDGLQITDGSPHLVSIQREKGLVKISVNGTEHFRKSVGNRITFVPSKLYIGGKPAIASVSDLSTNNLVESSALLSSSRMTRSLVIEDVSASSGAEEVLEDATATPETLSPSVTGDNDNGGGSGGGASIGESRVSSIEVIPYVEPEINEIFVINPFKGVIQDVRVNFSSNDAAPMTLGHSHLQQHAKIQNHYVAEFYPLEINSVSFLYKNTYC
jgi:hypothetical protein